MEPAGWALVIASAIGATGSVILQALHMFLSYKRDVAIKKDVSTVAKATNGLTEKIVTAELIAERIVNKAEVKANELLVIAAQAARSLAADKAAEKKALET